MLRGFLAETSIVETMTDQRVVEDDLINVVNKTIVTMIQLKRSMNKLHL